MAESSGSNGQVKEAQAIVAVAYDDDGKPVFWGCVEYADGGYLGIRRAGGGDVQELADGSASRSVTME